MPKRRPLLAIAVDDKRTVKAILLGTMIWAFLGWTITSILAGRGDPFEYAIRNYSIGELRILLWAGTALLTLGIVGVGLSFVGMGKALWRNADAGIFGLRFIRNGGGTAYDLMVRWYGGFLMIAGVMLVPLGASLLYILSTCRYMREF
jgi:hypothetical protein